MTIQLVVGHDAQVARWVQGQFPQIISFGDCTAMGVVDGNKIIAGVVYYNYHRHMIDASIAATNPRWCTRRVLRALFSYPFEQLGVRRIQMTVPKRDKQSRRALERFGFKFEGKRRGAMPDGSDATEYSMLREECKWLKEPNHEPGK